LKKDGNWKKEFVLPKVKLTLVYIVSPAQLLVVGEEQALLAMEK
jgi:hypothetical protein